MIAAPGDFFREDRAAQQQHRDAVGGDAADQQARQKIEILSQFQGEIIAVSGERIVPPIIAAMPISAHSPVSPSGIIMARHAPNAPPIISSGASTPPEVPEPSAIDQTSDLHDEKADERRPTSRRCSNSWIVS